MGSAHILIGPAALCRICVTDFVVENLNDLLSLQNLAEANLVAESTKEIRSLKDFPFSLGIANSTIWVYVLGSECVIQVYGQRLKVNSLTIKGLKMSNLDHVRSSAMSEIGPMLVASKMHAYWQLIFQMHLQQIPSFVSPTSPQT